jgi:hypothetical protein
MIPLTIKIFRISKSPNSGKNGKIFILGFLIYMSCDRFSWKKFLEDHGPPSGQGKLTFK